MYLDNLLDDNAKASTFSARVNFLIKTRGISKQWLADKLGISKQALNYLINHAIKPKYIDELAEYLQASPAWIASGEASPFIENKAADTVTSKLAVYHTADLIKALHDSEHLSLNPTTYVDYPTQTPHLFIAYQVEDDRLFPPFLQYTIFIVKKDMLPVEDNYILTLSEEAQSAHVTKYTGHLDNALTCIGVLVEARYIPAS